MELAEQVASAEQIVATKVSSGYSWTEIPRWHDGAFYFSDMYNHQILRMADDGTTEIVIDASDRKALSAEPGSADPGDTEVVLGGVGWLPDGRMLVVSMHERMVLVWDGVALETYADLRGIATSSCNDMVVDAEGRAYVTQLGYNLFIGEEATESFLMVIEPDGTARNVQEIGALHCGNGITITSDGTRVVVAEVDAACLTQLDRAPDGSLSGRRQFAQLSWLPDGICLDEEGGVWAGMPGSGHVCRFVEGGELTHAVTIPMDQGMGTAVVLGGEDRKRLYIACGLEVMDWAKSRNEGLGSIWVAETPFAGGENRP